jgi:hypothetical protein
MRPWPRSDEVGFEANSRVQGRVVALRLIPRPGPDRPLAGTPPAGPAAVGPDHLEAGHLTGMLGGGVVLQPRRDETPVVAQRAGPLQLRLAGVVVGEQLGAVAAGGLAARAHQQR